MPSSDIPLRPVQVLMDGERFHTKPNKPPGGNQKDFFAGDNAAFVNHKAEVTMRLSNIAQTLERNDEPIGFMHVQMRETALAKSHRPLDRLFTHRNKFALVGGDNDGNLIVQGAPRALQELSDLIQDKAEVLPRRKTDRNSGKLVEVVSEYRSELGSIEEIRLHDRDDRVGFEAGLAIETLRRKDAIGSYVIDLFRIDQDIAGRGAVDKAVVRFLEAIGEIPGGIEIRPALSEDLRSRLLHPTLAISLRLIGDTSRRSIILPRELRGGSVTIALPTRTATVGRPSFAVADLDPKRHEDVLALLAEQTLVRAVQLPVVLDEGNSKPMPSGKTISIPAPAPDGDYPILGVIDGGIAAIPPLAPWIAGSANLVPADERNESHGTLCRCVPAQCSIDRLR
jgi:hypothetical protein